MPSINSNTSALYAVNASRKTDRDMETSMQRLSTGLRITNAGDVSISLSVFLEAFTAYNALVLELIDGIFNSP